MVSLVNKFAAKIEEKKGALSEDEVSFKYYCYRPISIDTEILSNSVYIIIL